MRKTDDHNDPVRDGDPGCGEARPTSPRHIVFGLLGVAALTGGWVVLDRYLESATAVSPDAREVASALAFGAVTAVALAFATPSRRCGDCSIGKLFRRREDPRFPFGPDSTEQS